MSARRIAVGLWIAAIAFCAWQVTRADFVADLSSFLPEAPTAQQRLLVDQLREGAISRVMLVGIEGSDAATRARLSQGLAARLRSDARFASVANGAGSGFERERDLLLAYRYALSRTVGAERFTVEGLRAAIGETLDLLAAPAGLALKSLVTRDPTGELLGVVERLRPSGGPALTDGVWSSPDGRRALLVARTRASGSDTDAQADALAAVEGAFAQLAAGSGATLLASGPGVFSARARAMIRADVEKLALVSMGLVATLLILAYRSPLALGLGLIPVASGALAGVAAVALGFGVVHGITLGFGTTLIGEAVDYSIYLFVQSERSRPDGDARWIEGFWPTIRLGVLTSIAGFSALLFSGLPGLAQLGLYSITGLIAAALVTRFVLPQLLPAGLRIRDLTAQGEVLARFAAGLTRGRWLAVAIVAGAAGVLAGHHATLFDRRIDALNPVTARDRAVDAELRSAIGASDTRHLVVVHGASTEAALEGADRVGVGLDGLVASAGLAGYDSPTTFLPSAATQRARLAGLPPAAELRTRLDAALAGMPLRAARLEPFIADVERARAGGVLTREAIAGTALEPALDGLLFRDASGRWTAMIGLRAPAGRAIDPAALAAVLAASGTGAMTIDMRAEVDQLYSGYFERALLMSAVGLAIIVALLAVALRSPARVVRVMLPLAGGVMVVAAAHALMGTRLSLLHLVGLLLVVAIGSNYALFFDRMAQPGATATARTLASLALANLTTVASFGVLALSSVPVLRAIGATVALGAFVTLVFAAMLAHGGLQFAPGKNPHADPHRSGGIG